MDEFKSWDLTYVDCELKTWPSTGQKIPCLVVFASEFLLK